MLLRHPNRRRSWWFDYTDASGDYKIGICGSKAEARKWAHMCGGTYRGRWRFSARLARAYQGGR